MAKRMSDDDVMNYVYGKLFGDLDGIESHSMFDEKQGEEGMHAAGGTAENAEPESHETGGLKITVQPMMESAQEDDQPDTMEDDDEEDELKGIGSMSPLMAQLHGKR